MFAFIETPPFLPVQASEFAFEYDLLFWYTSAVTAAGGALVYALLIFCCFRFAKRSETQKPMRILGSTKLELIWTVIPLLFFLSFFVWGVRLWDTAINPPKEAAEREYFTVGKQWMWKIQDPDGLRHINELTLQEGVAVKMTGTSEDVIHDFGIPAFRSKFDVVPGRYTAAWYKPKFASKEGKDAGHESHHIFCDQYCGQGHSQMVGRVHVLDAKNFEEWKAGIYRSPNKDGLVAKRPVDGSPAWQGRILFHKLQCNGCHFTQSPSDEVSPKAPSLENIWGTKREMQDGKSFIADDIYIKNAIQNPSMHIRSGWQGIMPAFHNGLATEIDIINLTQYIKSMKAGDLPYRTDKSPTPIGGAPKASPGAIPPPAPMPENKAPMPDNKTNKEGGK
jgi:cytochrome c oxidase subunit 2